MQFMEKEGALVDEADPDTNRARESGGMPATSIGKSKNINSNTDFTVAGGATGNTKHVPYAVRKGGM